MCARNILMLFAPKFDGFGRDVARAFAARCDGGRVYALCAGPRLVRERVEAGLGDLGGRCWRLEEEEEAWLLTPTSTSELERLERVLGTGTFGRLVTADRSVGRGFIRGGLPRPPNRVGRLAARSAPRSAQRYVLGLYRFLDAVFREAKPDVVFCYAVASAPSLALAELCRARGVPFCRLTPTRMGDGYSVDVDAAGRQTRVARRFEQARDGHAPFPPSSLEEARNQLETYRTRPVQPGYTQRRSELLRLLRRCGYFPLFCLKEFARGRSPVLQAARLLFDVWVTWRGTFTERGWFSSQNDLPRAFVYFPLHVDPEASTMVLSPWHTDQITVIETLAKAAPAHMQVVVKEHLPMQGRRPPNFYRRIAAMPRVVLLGPSHSSFNLIGKAALTAVITGTAAWESILMRRPTLIMGDSPFLPINEGFVYETDMSRLPAAIEAAVSLPPASDEILTLYIAALQSEAFNMPSSLLWGTYEKHSADQRHTASESIAGAIVRVMDEFVHDAATRGEPD